MLLIRQTVIDFSVILCAFRKVILEMFDPCRYLSTALPSPSLPLPLICLSLSLCQLSALAERHACRSASDRCSSTRAKRRGGTRAETETGRKRTQERESMRGEERRRRKKRDRRRRRSETTESRPFPIVSKGTRRWIRPWPIITARWAVEGRALGGRLKNKLARDISE